MLCDICQILNTFKDVERVMKKVMKRAEKLMTISFLENENFQKKDY